MNDLWGLAIYALFIYVFGRLLIETAIDEGLMPLLIISAIISVIVMWWSERK